MEGTIAQKNAIGPRARVLHTVRLATLSKIAQRNRIWIGVSNENNHHDRINSKGTKTIPARQISRIHQQRICTMFRTNRISQGDQLTSRKGRISIVGDPIMAGSRGDNNLMLESLLLLSRKLRLQIMLWRVWF